MWMSDNKDIYSQLIFGNFTVIDENKENESGIVKINHFAFREFLSMLDSGRYNMLDNHSVIKECTKLGYEYFRKWLEVNMSLYS